MRGITTSPRPEGNAVVGTVEVNREGHISYNGKPLEGESEANLRALCKESKMQQEVQPNKIQYNQ